MTAHNSEKAQPRARRRCHLHFGFHFHFDSAKFAMGFDFDSDSDFEFAFDLCKLIRWRILLAAFAFYVILDASLRSTRLEGG